MSGKNIFDVKFERGCEGGACTVVNYSHFNVDAQHQT